MVEPVRLAGPARRRHYPSPARAGRRRHLGGQPSQPPSPRSLRSQPPRRPRPQGRAKRAPPLGRSSRRGDSVTEPRDLFDLVPADVRTEFAAAIAALELHGPAVTKALRRLDQATTAAWNAVSPVDRPRTSGGSSSAQSVS